jgi:hypothetical protein
LAFIVAISIHCWVKPPSHLISSLSSNSILPYLCLAKCQQDKEKERKKEKQKHKKKKKENGK